MNYDAVIIGAGPNGLSAAVELARNGLSVCVMEAEETIGGGTRSAELTLPGFVHDVCSAVHPMASLSPFFKGLPLKDFGLDGEVTGYDINNKTWQVYGNSYWPKHILIDRDGFVRYEHPGYGTLDDFEEALADLLDLSFSKPESAHEKEEIKSEAGNDLVNENDKLQQNSKEQDEVSKIYGMHFNGMAPEICVGYSRIRRFGNNQKAKINEYNVFTEPQTVMDNTVYLRGKWRWDKEGIQSSLEHKERNPAIVFKYNMASNVNVIVGSTDGKPAIANIMLDGEFLTDGQIGFHGKKDSNSSFFEITWPHIMNIVKTSNPESHVLEILPKTENFYFYTFVFG